MLVTHDECKSHSHIFVCLIVNAAAAHIICREDVTPVHIWPYIYIMLPFVHSQCIMQLPIDGGGGVGGVGQEKKEEWEHVDV